MSRRLLLAPGTAAGAWLPVYDLYSEAMPIGHAHVHHVGPDREHTVIQDALDAAFADLSGAHDRSLVVVDPGTYVEKIAPLPRVDLAGATGNPADVVVEHTCPTGGSPLWTSGGPTWIGGLTIRLLDYPERTGSGVYSIHHAGHGVTILEALRLEADGSGSIGMDGDAGSVTWLRGCVLVAEEGFDGSATNMHGAESNTAPLRVVWENCTAHQVNYNSGGSGQPDQMYVSGGNIGAVEVNGAGVLAYIDVAVPSVLAGDGVDLTRTAVLPPLPVRGTA